MRAGLAMFLTTAVLGCASIDRQGCLSMESAAEKLASTRNADEFLAGHKLASESFPYAIFSYNAYITPDTKERSLPLPQDWSCIYPKPPEECMTKSHAIKGRGFEYLVFMKKGADGNPQEIVFAVEGTESWLDWLLGNVLSKQYYEANKRVQFELQRLDERPEFNGRIKAKQVTIVATGHSLGGGLAEHIAFCFHELGVRAVSFNTSPRNFPRSCQGDPKYGERFAPRRPPEPQIEEIRTQRISRLHQHHEVLSYFRHIFPDDKYSDYSYPFLRGTAVQRHSMRAMAVSLTSYASCPAIASDHRRRAANGVAAALYPKMCGRLGEEPQPVCRGALRQLAESVESP